MGNSETPVPETTEPSTQITVQQEIGRVEDGEVIGVKVDTIIGDVTVKAVQIIDSFVERALTAAEEAKQARAIEAQHQAGMGLSLLATVKAAACSPWIIGGAICGALDLLAYTFALRKVPVSMAYPIISSFAYAIIVCGAAVWFSERLSAWQIVGIGTIMAGVCLVASGMAKTP